MFTDTHCHLSKDDYEDIEKIIENAKKNKIYRLFISGCDKKSIKEAVEIGEKYENVYLELGFHPSEVDVVTDEDITWLENIIKTNKKVIAVGEIGLDYYWVKDNKEKQKELFEKMILLSKKYNLPVVIHSRDAFQDTYDILKKYQVKGVIHCFSGNIENAKMYISLGFKLGIGGVLTFKNSKLKEVIKELSLSDIILETDSPYLTPEPYRGMQNEPKNVLLIAKKIEEIKNIREEELSKYTENNIKNIFTI